MYITEERLVGLLLMKFEEVASVLEAQMQVQIERSDITNRILEELEKKYKKYKEQLEKRGKNK